MSELAEQVVDGDRRALARAITLVESTRADHRAEAEALLAEVLPHVGNSVRVGISGAPGAGKSTFIEALGGYLVEQTHRVAVLAVDPSSTRSGGSILGDKTRMEQLTRSPLAFVRPSPTGGTLGGVARRTREALLLCEAAGFDVVLVETVGVGQSEVKVAAMVDLFLVLVAPGGGDELQGLKRGIMELADLVVVNKADGDLAATAAHTAADYAAALHLVRPRIAGWDPRVLTCSALAGRRASARSGTRSRSSAPGSPMHSPARRAEQSRAVDVVGDHRLAPRSPRRRPGRRCPGPAARARGGRRARSRPPRPRAPSSRRCSATAPPDRAGGPPLKVEPRKYRRQDVSARGILAGVVLVAIVVLAIISTRVVGRRAARTVDRVTALLERNEARFRAMVRDSNDIMAIVDPHGRLVYASPATERILGLDIEPLIGADVFDLIHPDDRAIAKRGFDLTRTGHDADRIEVRLRHADGSWRVVEAVATNLLDDPAVAGIVISARDLTDRRLAEAELREAQERFRSAFEHAPIGMALTSIDGRLFRVNRALVQILGRGESELLASSILDLSHPDDRDDVSRVDDPPAHRRDRELPDRAALPAPRRAPGVGLGERVDRARPQRPAAVLRQPDRRHRRAQGER